MKSNIIYHARIALFAVFFLMGAMSVQAQIDFRVSLGSDGQTYTVYAKPKASINPSSNTITGTGQATLVVPHGFTHQAVVNVSGNWSVNATVKAPVENPNFDYISVGLVADQPKILYVTGQETVLFRIK